MDWRKKTITVGEAKYKYHGNCWGCDKRMFVCASDPVRADVQMADRTPTFYADGTFLCKECVSGRL